MLLKVRLIGVCRNQRQTEKNNQSDGNDKIEGHPSSASGSRLAEAANLLYKQRGKGKKKKVISSNLAALLGYIYFVLGIWRFLREFGHLGRGRNYPSDCWLCLSSVQPAAMPWLFHCPGPTEEQQQSFICRHIYCTIYSFVHLSSGIFFRLERCPVPSHPLSPGWSKLAVAVPRGQRHSYVSCGHLSGARRPLRPHHLSLGAFSKWSERGSKWLTPR